MTPLKKLLTGTTSLSHPQNITRMPQLIIPMLELAGMSTFWATVTYYVAATLVTSWALNALTPSIPSGSGMQGLLANARSPLAPHEYVYGQVRKGGANTYLEATGDENKFLHMIIALAGHEVEAIDDIYINDEIVTLDGNGFVTTGGWAENGLKVRIKKHLGAANQTVDTDLLAESNLITSDFKGQGIAYLYVRLEYDQDVFANGIPLFTAMVRGKKVGDPRTAQVNYSNNAALCIRDYLRSSYGLADTSTDDTIFAVAANVCDENIVLDGGATEKRYTMNGVVSSDTPVGNVLQSMMTSCAGTLFWGQGAWQLKAGYYTAPVKNFTLDDLRGPISMQTRTSMRDIFNVVRGTFNDANQDYITADFPQIDSDAFLAEDNNVETALDLELPFTTSSATAQRIAKLTLFRGREQITFSADFGLSAFGVQVGDIVSLTNTRYGWSAKEFEVIGWKFSSSQEAGDLRINLTLHETSEAAFDWDAEETAIISNNSTLPNFATVDALTNLALESTTVINDDGTAIPALKVTWDVSPNQFVQYYEIQYKHSGEAQYTSVIGTTNSYTIQPVLNNYVYSVRVRAINSLGARSPFITTTGSSVGDTTAPSTPSGLSAVGTSKAITVSWTNPADLDLSHVEVWENASNNLSTATMVGSSSSTNFYRPNLANNSQKYYWIRAVDFSENKSPFTTGVSATTTFIYDDDFANGIYSLFTDQGLYAIEDVTSLPASGDFTGQKLFNRTDGKLYQWTGSVWEQVVGGAEDFSDLTGAIAGAQIPDGLIDTLKLANDAVTNAKIATNAVTADVIASGAITETKISSGAITTSKIAAGAVTASEIAAGSITSSQIAADTIAAGNIATGAITADEIASNAITSAKITAGAILGDKIAANAITGAKIAAGVITGDKITANTITGGLIAASGIITNTAQITDGVVTNAKIANAAITSAKIQDLAVTSAKIGDLNADKITAGVLNVARIPTLSTNKFSTMSGLYGNSSGDTGNPAASGTITSFSYTPSSASVALLTLFVQGVLETRPGGEGNYIFVIEVFLNSSLVLSTSGLGNTDGPVGITLQGNYAFSAPANTSQTVTVGWRQFNGRKGRLQINNSVISSIFTQD